MRSQIRERPGESAALASAAAVPSAVPSRPVPGSAPLPSMPLGGPKRDGSTPQSRHKSREERQAPPQGRSAPHAKSSEWATELLRPADFPAWNDLVARSVHGTVFHYSWWLEAAGHDLEILGARDRQGRLVAGLPLPRKRRGRLLLFHNPPLAPYLGPVFDLAGVAKLREQLYVVRTLGESLARAIPRFDSFIAPVGATGPDLQGFLWAGFRAELSYTFRFDPGTNPRDVLATAARIVRQKLRADQTEAISLEKESDIAVLAELNRETFDRQRRAAPLSLDRLRRMWGAAAEHDCGAIYVARDRDGRPLSAVFVVRDSRASYQIVSGMNAAGRQSSAGYMTTWAAISEALSSGCAFDFEGSRVRGVEQYYRFWGAPARPVWILRKTGSLAGQLAVFWAGRRMARQSERDTSERRIGRPNGLNGKE